MRRGFQIPRSTWLWRSVQRTQGPFASAPAGSRGKPTGRGGILLGSGQLLGLQRTELQPDRNSQLALQNPLNFPVASKEKRTGEFCSISARNTSIRPHGDTQVVHSPAARSPHTQHHLEREGQRGTHSKGTELWWKYGFSYGIGQKYKPKESKFSFPGLWPGLLSGLWPGLLWRSKQFEMSAMSSCPIQELRSSLST